MSERTPARPDPVRQEEFTGRMLQVLNDSCLGHLCSLGHRAGLFGVMSGLPSATSAQIAEAAGLDERYVREWLGGMTVGGIVEYAPEDGGYRLPPEHAAVLSRAAGPDNMAAFMQYLAMMGDVEDEVLAAFRNGGGVPYSSYPHFQDVQAEETARVYDAALTSTIVPLVPGLTGQLRSGVDVLDIGTGQGHAVNLLARVPRKPLRGDGHLRRGHRHGSGRGRAVGAGQRPLRGGRYGRTHRLLRPDHGLRRGP